MTQQINNTQDEDVYIFPASYAQQRLWFLDQLEPNSPFYNIPSAVRFKGSLNVPALEKAFDEIIQRHEVLRTTFAVVDGEPVQVISPSSNLTVAKIDLRDLPPLEREAEALRLANVEARKPFNLSEGPLIRFSLLQLDSDDHVVLLNMHHIISDGWSMGVLIREIAVLYSTFSHGKASPLPELPIQYGDFAQWQQEWLTGEVLEKQISFWIDLLGEQPPVLELPTDRPRPAVQSARGGKEALLIPGEFVDSMKKISKEEDATLFMSLLAAFQTLLFRYTGQDDISVGSPIANRTRGEIEGLIGFFVNTLVLRTDLSGDPTFRELLQRVKEMTLGAYGNQDVPFEKIVEVLQPERDMSHTPLFQVMFILQNTPMQVNMKMPDVNLSTLDLNMGTSTFDLTLMLTERSDGISAKAEFNTDIFDATTAQRLLGHFQSLLAAISKNPDLPISKLALLDETEKVKILTDWNRTKVKYAQNLCVHHFFETQVKQTPDKAAVVFTGKELTYDELNRRANQLARYLIQRGVQPETLVGISAERSLDMIVGLLGILKTGGAYLPLDPNYPADRLALMLEDSKVSILVTQQKLVEQLPGENLDIICLDTDWAEIEKENNENLSTQVSPENLAYVIYTSGSTGKPKGVQISHAAVVNHNLAVRDIFSLNPADRILQFATINFDAAVEEIFPALAIGATVVLRNNDILLSGADLLKMIQQEALTVLDLPTAYWHEWVAELANSHIELPECLRLVILGGDKAAPERFRTWNKLGGRQVTLVNTYGPTETTVISTAYEPTAADRERTDLFELPIGRPIQNTQTYVLDSNFQPAPVGVPGELCIGGSGVARGYLARPDLTADRFVPNPYSADPGDRIYRTGDLVRYRPDGNIDFIGRVDFQVKIRGFRVEIGEIESALRQFPNMKEAVVIARETGQKSNEKQLVAYYVLEQEQVVSAAELRIFLKKQLPDYMIPAIFVDLETMPKLPSGKINRKALPEPSQERQELSQEFVAPRNSIEEILAQAWQEILDVEKVGVFDNFFEIGGHSLLATRVISRIREAFEIELPLRTVFEQPTVAGLSQQIEQAQLEENTLQAPPIQPVPRDGVLPLSFAQQRLWFLDQLEPGSPAYNIPSAVRLQGDLNISVLKKTINEIVRRHESLRTNFSEEKGKGVQIIAPTLTVEIPEIDLAELPETEREQEVMRLAGEEAKQPFNLSDDPLFRVTLLKLGVENFVILFTMHHIISDDWSTKILVKEIAILYNAFAQNAPSPLPDLALQYADFSHWQQNWLQGEVLETQLTYWKDQLGGSPAVLELPTDRPRPAVQTFNGSYQTFEFSEDVSLALKNLGASAGTTLFMTMLAAFNTLLYRYSDQDSINVGTPIANRTRAEIEGLIGFFVNTLVLRTDLSGQPTFTELLKRVRETALGAYAHQDIPFEKLVDVLKPQRELSHSPLFQVMFVLQNISTGGQKSAGALNISPLQADSGTAKFDLTLFIMERENQISGALEFNTDLFDETTISRMIDHFRMLIEAIAADPEQRIDQLPLLSAAEQQQLVVEYNETQADYPLDQFVHQLFEANVELYPDRVAVEINSYHLTYWELNQKANQLAHYLISQGVGPESLVGICVERSLEMMIGLLGVLKAGGAYVPLDPTYPIERTTFILNDSAVQILLTQDDLVSNLPDSPTQLVRLDTEWNLIEQESRENPVGRLLPENLAYMIYTSGSTGRPKGTLISHKGLINYLHWCVNVYPLQEGRGSLVHSSLAFDATITGLYAPLISGRTVTLSPETQDLEVLSTVLQNNDDYSLIKITPAHLELLGQQLTPEQARGRTHAFVIGGENLTTEHIAFWQANAPDTRLINEYGPTETVVGCMNYQSPIGEEKVGSVPVGYPIANTQIYLLDRNFYPVPVGVAGEMYIGGVGVARGYLNLAELTAERFVPNPFGIESGDRLYKTGDLARFLADGNIEFLGRIDFQVKIRGFRIELGEIEATLSQHAALREVVVLASPDISGNQRLVAYYILEQEPAPTVSEIRNFLQAKLPDYMIPTAYMQLDALPLTSNGKVDRKALPEPDHERPELEGVFVAPRTPAEEMLAGVWMEILGIGQVGVYDNFFELGGHSLLATQIVSRIREAFAVEIPLRALFEAPNIAMLARAIETARQSADGMEAPPMVPVSRDQDLPLSFAQQRLWFLDQLEPNSPFYNIPSALRLQGKLNISALEKSIHEIIRTHEALRTTFQAIEGQPFQIISSESQLNIHKLDLRKLSKEKRDAEARHTIKIDAKKPFDLSQGPLMRVTLLQLDEEEHIVVFTTHHIISDGWSIGVLIKAVADLYSAYSTGKDERLPDLPIQYADYAYWQRQWLQGEVLEKQLSFWKDQLRGCAPILELPTDHPRPAVQSFNGALVSKKFSAELTESLQLLSRRQGATMFMTLLAAFKTLLFRYSRQTDISVGSPIANRNRAETEGLIGFFVNTLVFRTELSGEQSFNALLARVKESALGAYAHQDIPFEMLVEKIQPDRDLSHTPLFQVMFVLQNLPVQEMDLPELKMSTLTAENDTANFDLTLGMIERADGLSATLEYNSDLFEAATITRMLEHFQNLLESITITPDLPISRLPLLVENEMQQLEQWNQTQVEYPADKTAPQLFEAQVEQTPENMAVVFENQTLTYNELNNRANQLAHHLRKLGVGPEVIVGVCVERSIEMVIGLLGIMKAGGAYLPMDPNYPPDRLVYMIDDSDVSVILTQDHLLARLPKKKAQLICLDTGWNQISYSQDDNPPGNITAKNLAYVIYTSGSTGQPKGVLLQHQGLCNLASSQIREFQVTEKSHVLQFASFSFDASVSEVFMTILAGATLYLVRREMLLPGAGLKQILRDYKITTVTFPPSLLAVLAENEFPYLKTIISAGEACTQDVANRWREGRLFLNGYGPTENTVHTSTYAAAHEVVGTSLPIGRPISNVQVYILDEHWNTAPVGVPGELCIGGVGLARGYLNRPELTAQKFIPNMFGSQPGARLYRTGDLARFLPDGNLEFLGRIDHQVKIRGFRIELEEIEILLSQHPAVKDEIVIVREDSGADKRIVAYIIPDQDVEATIEEFQIYLKDKLPDYMMPSAIVLLESFPLTPNGKVNRRDLPAPDYLSLDANREFVAPRDTLELKLAEIWQEILGVSEVGIKDNFFEIGGHSLLAVRLLAKIEKKFNREIQLVSLFQDPTIEHLSNLLREEGDAEAWSPIIEMQPNESGKKPFFLVHPSGGSVHWYTDLAKRLGAELPLFGIQARGLVGKQKLHTEIESMASYYVDAILAKQPEGPYFLGGWSLGVIIAYEMARQLQALGQQVGLLALFDQGPLVPKEAPIDDSEMLVNLFSHYFPLNVDDLRKLDPEDRLKQVLKKAKKAKVVPRFIRLKQFRYYIEVIDVQTQAWRRYEPKPFPEAVTLFRAENNEDNLVLEPDLSWSQFVQGGIEIIDVPGTHITMLQEPNTQILANRILECVDKVISSA